MSSYCVVCGRELTKTVGPVGPKCLQKLRPRNIRVRGMTKKQHEKICIKYDIYQHSEEELAQPEQTEEHEDC